MLEKGKTYAYFYTTTLRGNDITITQINNGVAMAISGVFGGMGPFAMHFDVNTGEGVNDHVGTHLETINS